VASVWSGRRFFPLTKRGSYARIGRASRKRASAELPTTTPPPKNIRERLTIFVRVPSVWSGRRFFPLTKRGSYARIGRASRKRAPAELPTTTPPPKNIRERLTIFVCPPYGPDAGFSLSQSAEIMLGSGERVENVRPRSFRRRRRPLKISESGWRTSCALRMVRTQVFSSHKARILCWDREGESQTCVYGARDDDAAA
jgi:hypothetical protein